MIRRARKKLPLWASLLINILSALVILSLVQGFIAKVYRVPSGSMENTLQGARGGRGPDRGKPPRLRRLNSAAR